MHIRWKCCYVLALTISLLNTPTASACNMNPTAVISAPAASLSHIHGTGVSFVGTSSTANCGWISAYIWRNGVTVLSYSSSFSYNVTLEPEQVDSVITVSLQVNNSYGRSQTVYRTITIKRDHQSQYFVKDHLGSPRVVVDGKGEVLSHTDYYPFGMVMPDRADNYSLSNDRVKFTGYLLEEEGDQDTYHAEARGYDPVIGRFTSRDPHARNYPGISPYSYVLNNPLKYLDPDGRDTLYFIDQAENPANKRVYTADIHHVKNGRTVGIYPNGGSTYPNHPDSHNDHNTVDEGEHSYNNENGHKGDKNAGVNLVDENGNRNSPGKDKDGYSVTMTNVNVHSGQPRNDNGLDNRGSAGCPTICPTVAPILLPQIVGTTGTVVIERNKTSLSTIAKSFHSAPASSTRVKRP